MPKTFGVYTREMVFSYYEIKGEDKDTPQTIRAKIKENRIDLSSKNWSEAENFTITSVEEKKGD